jgi:hypothetical protein
MCWRLGKINGPDIAANHFPVVGYLLGSDPVRAVSPIFSVWWGSVKRSP